MTERKLIFCLDTNVLIQSWQKYYNPRICPDYWDVLSELGRRSQIFLPEAVYGEIQRMEDDLAAWVKQSAIPVDPVTTAVTEQLKSIYSANVTHSGLVDNTKGRSLADPWVIAHALDKQATVVTKEDKITASNSSKVKIPNVCENMGVRWINDFLLMEELGIKFSCRLY